jgi:BirA family biotin operon repressor/biotin-[acetyl-CoA-carboxylase] ligase
MAEKPLSEGTVIVAEVQTGGRGVDGNTWESEEGKNLTFSMVIYPTYLFPVDQFYLTKAISLGVCHTVMKYLGPKCSIKWPNDVYFGNDKIAGILIQNGIQGNRFSYSIAGIGLNVNQVNFSKDIPNPVSMKLVSERDHDLDDLLDELCLSIDGYLELLKEGRQEKLDEEYISSLFRINEWAEYVYKGDRIRGRIKGVNRYGHLILDVPSGRMVECDLKEISFVI